MIADSTEKTNEGSIFKLDRVAQMPLPTKTASGDGEWRGGHVSNSGQRHPDKPIQKYKVI
jgi:hypothetical protein